MSLLPQPLDQGSRPNWSFLIPILLSCSRPDHACLRIIATAKLCYMLCYTSIWSHFHVEIFEYKSFLILRFNSCDEFKPITVCYFRVEYLLKTEI